MRKLPFRDLSYYGVIKEKIGEGVYASVYLYENENGEKYAVKASINDMFTEKNSLITYSTVREISSLVYCDDLNILPIIDVCFKWSMTYIIMPVMTGSLDKLSVDYKYKKMAIYQVFKSIEYLHSRDIIHRDIKTENFLYDIENGLPIVKLADFGIARFGKCSSDINIFTNDMYTLTYRPPEIILGSGVYDEKSEVWAGGIMASMIFNKNYIFYGKNEAYEPKYIFHNMIKLLTITPETWPGIEDFPRFNDYYDSKYFKERSKNWAIKETNGDEEFANFLKFVLVADPIKRPTLYDILKHPYFEDIRQMKKFYDSPPKTTSCLETIRSYNTTIEMNSIPHLESRLKRLLYYFKTDFILDLKLNESALYTVMKIIFIFLSKNHFNENWDDMNWNVLIWSVLIIISKIRADDISFKILEDNKSIFDMYNIKNLEEMQMMQKLQEMQNLVLTTINFELNQTTPYTFIEFYKKFYSVDVIGVALEILEIGIPELWYENDETVALACILISCVMAKNKFKHIDSINSYLFTVVDKIIYHASDSDNKYYNQVSKEYNANLPVKV